MATDLAKAQEALVHIRQTTISYPEYIHRTLDPNYHKKNSHWYKALALMHSIGTFKPPSPPNPHEHDLAQSLLYATDDPFGAFKAPSYYTILVSADPAYRAWENSTWFQTAKDLNRKIGVWCDCDATPASVAREMKERYNFDTWSGQAESDAQAMNALGEHCPLIVLNAAMLSKDVRDKITHRIETEELSATQECYTNEGWPWPETTSAIDIPVASLTLGFYAGRAGYVGVAAYRAHGAKPGDSAYVSGIHPGELEQLP